MTSTAKPTPLHTPADTSNVHASSEAFSAEMGHSLSMKNKFFNSAANFWATVSYNWKHFDPKVYPPTMTPEQKKSCHLSSRPQTYTLWGSK